MSVSPVNYSNWDLFKEILHFVRPYWKRFFLGSFCRLSSDIVWLWPPVALGQLINFASNYQLGDPLKEFWFLMISVWIVASYHFFTHDLAKYLLYPIAEQTRIDAMLKGIQHMFILPQEWHEKENSGNKIQRMSRAGHALNDLIRLYTDLFIESSVNIVGITIILFTLGPTVNVLLISFFITYFFLSLLLTRKSKEQSLKVNIEEEKIGGLYFESINNIFTVKALGLFDSITKVLQKASQTLSEVIKKRVFWYRFRSGSLNLYQEIFRQILIFYVIWQVLQGHYEVGMIATLMFYFEKISSSASELSELSFQFNLSRIDLMRYRYILNENPGAERSGQLPFPKNWKVLEIKNLSFAYQGRTVLKNINLKIRRGEKIGLIGISGTGKSTFFKVLLKLYDRYEGDILFDGISLRDIKRSSYLKELAYVPQETELFNFSLKDNVALAVNGKVDSNRLKRALKVAHVKDFLEKLPAGENSLIGEKGVKLSGGEKQRVGIARAIYKEPQFLLLDEATSHLDTESEEKIRLALHEVFKNLTALVIAHRTSTLKEMDRILVMKRGEVEEILENDLASIKKIH